MQRLQRCAGAFCMVCITGPAGARGEAGPTKMHRRGSPSAFDDAPNSRRLPGQRHDVQIEHHGKTKRISTTKDAKITKNWEFARGRVVFGFFGIFGNRGQSLSFRLDSLTPFEGSLAHLAPLAKGLIDGDKPCLDLTALTEGTVAAMFVGTHYYIEDSLG